MKDKVYHGIPQYTLNKKGDFPSLIFAIVIIFAIALILFFYSHLMDRIYGGLDDYFNSSATYNESVARDSLNKINSTNQSAWDYAVLIIAIGYILALFVSAYSTRISAFFFWIYAILSLMGLGIAVLCANLWQDLSSSSQFSSTISNFPITNSLLGTYYPTFVTFIILIVIIVTFGKFQQEQ